MTVLLPSRHAGDIELPAGPGVPGDEGPPPYEVLAALVASLRGELAKALATLGQARAELAQARERSLSLTPG